MTEQGIIIVVCTLVGALFGYLIRFFEEYDKKKKEEKELKEHKKKKK